MRADGHVKHDVEAELHWNPEVDDTDIKVSVHEGTVSLEGSARNYADKIRAEALAKRITGVTGVTNNLRVRLDSEVVISDAEIAQIIDTQLRMALPLAGPTIKVLVCKGHVSLEGTVSWHFQRERAVEAARRVKGVVDVANLIEVVPTITAGELRHKIEAAFRRSAAIDAKHVSVEECRGEVTLRGKVRSWAERDDAERAAWAAPGVTRVVNEIAVKGVTQ